MLALSFSSTPTMAEIKQLALACFNYHDYSRPEIDDLVPALDQQRTRSAVVFEDGTTGEAVADWVFDRGADVLIYLDDGSDVAAWLVGVDDDGVYVENRYGDVALLLF